MTRSAIYLLLNDSDGSLVDQITSDCQQVSNHHQGDSEAVDSWGAGDLEDTNRHTHSHRAHGTGQIHTGVSVNILYNVMYSLCL